MSAKAIFLFILPSFLFAVISAQSNGNAGGVADQVVGTILQTLGNITPQMRHDAIQFSKSALVLHGDQDLPRFATAVKEMYDAEYGGFWNVFVAAGRMSFKTMLGTYVILTVNTDTVFIGK